MQERASLPHCCFNTAGISLWSFSLLCGRSKGRSTSRRSSCSKISCSRNLRQIADALAKGKLAITIVLGRSEYKPFLNAGLPIKEAPTPKEGLPASSGYGVLGSEEPAPSEYGQGLGQLVLGKEGQEFYARVMKQGTRRLDVDTKWMSQIGVDAAKDVIRSRNIIVSETTSKTK